MKTEKLLKKQKSFVKLAKIGISINSDSLINKCQRKISETLNLRNEDCIVVGQISLISSKDKKYKICCLIREYVDLNFGFLFKDINADIYQKEIEKNFKEVHRFLPLPETQFVFRTIDKQIAKFLNLLK